MYSMHIEFGRCVTLAVGLFCATAPGIAFGQRSSYSFDNFSKGRDTAADRFGAFASGLGLSAGSLGRGGSAWGPAPAIGSLSLNPYEDAAREASGDRSSPSRVTLCAKTAVRENAVLIGVTTINCIGAVKSPKSAEKCLDGLKTSAVSLGVSFASCLGDSND